MNFYYWIILCKVLWEKKKNISRVFAKTRDKFKREEDENIKQKMKSG
jgi:hypothetical protein